MALLLFLAVSLVGFGTHAHLLGERGLGLALVALGAVALVAALTGRGRGTGLPDGTLRLAMRAVVVLQVVLGAVALLGRLPGDATSVVVLAILSAFVLAGLAVDQLADRPRFGVVGIAAIGGATVVLGLCWWAAPVAIDVLTFQQVGSERLLAGVNPYAAGYPNPYPPGLAAEIYAPELVSGDVLLTGFPYPPLSLVLSTLGFVAGDVRLAHLASFVVSGVVLVVVGRAHWWSRAGGLMLLTTPTGLFVVQQSWTEPFVVVALATAAVLPVRRRDVTGTLALGALVAVKQYALILAVPLLARLARDRGWNGALRTALGAGGVAAAVTLPFALWNLPAFIDSLVRLHLAQPFRPDALSIPAFLAARAGLEVDGTVLLIVTAVAVALATWLAARVARNGWWYAAVGSGVVMLAFVLFAKQAHANYYLVVVAAACIGLALLGRTSASGQDVS